MSGSESPSSASVAQCEEESLPVSEVEGARGPKRMEEEVEEEEEEEEEADMMKVLGEFGVEECRKEVLKRGDSEKEMSSTQKEESEKKQIQALRTFKYGSHVAQQLNTLRKMGKKTPNPDETRLTLSSLEGHLKFLLSSQEGLDSEATESSSGGESCDEFDSFPSQNVQYLPIQKRAKWTWLKNRASLASKWTWLTAQISDLEFKIRQQTELYRQIRAAKAPILLEKPHLPQANSTQAAKECSVRCSCLLPERWCAICYGKRNTARVPLREGRDSPQSIALLDHSYHHVISSKSQDVSLDLHMMTKIKNRSWLTAKDASQIVPATLSIKKETSNEERLKKPMKKKKKASGDLECTDPLLDGSLLLNNKSVKKKKKSDKSRRRSLTLGYDASFHDYGTDDMDDLDSSPLPSPSISGDPNNRTWIEHVKRRRESAYDIDNIVIPYSIAASTRVERIKYKEIITPTWRIVREEEEFEVKDFLSRSKTGLSQSTYEVRHRKAELDEQRRWKSLPWKQTGGQRVRSRRQDSKTELGSGCNTPDPLSPGMVDTLEVSTRPSTPLSVSDETPQSIRERRRTTSSTKLKDRIDDHIVLGQSPRSTTPNSIDQVPVVDTVPNKPPFEARTFPISETEFEKMAADMPIPKVSVSYSQPESQSPKEEEEETQDTSSSESKKPSQSQSISSECCLPNNNSSGDASSDEDGDYVMEDDPDWNGDDPNDPEWGGESRNVFLRKTSMMDPLRTKIAISAVCSRAFVFVLSIVSNHLIPDHDAYDVFQWIKVPLNSDDAKPKPLDWIFTFFLEGLTRWDGQHFLHIANNGYTYENSIAFFPFFPKVVGIVAHFLHWCQIDYDIISFNICLILSATLINFFGFILAALVLFDLSRKVLKDEYLAYKAALFFCINPASIFFSAAYSETLFSLFSFYAMLKIEKSFKLQVSILLSLPSATRANGWYAFMNFCRLTKSDRNMSRAIIEYAKFHPSLKLPSDEPSPWCYDRLPIPYSYVQDHYWNVGFLRSYQIKQVPNFIIAIPILYLVFWRGYEFIKKHKVFSKRLGLNPYVEPNDYVKLISSKNLPKNVLVYVVHSLVLATFCILFIHIQVSTRLLCSSCPVIYWYAAALTTHRNRRHTPLIESTRMEEFVHIIEKKSNLESAYKSVIFDERPVDSTDRWLRVYFMSYTVLGTVMFSNFLPWT
ncbi:PIGV [Lepeophtheirus salmonis]|uniref:PIGV n=1 Tax=Lepeophtheirus salmonis TaxID=72036 RepID=A0A7R8CUW0_LEPSM|nr:PIGV [Lepeophtheirus salmonis]CAF2938521.1 PIGV [Lepeophtheirus salmonis]